MSPRVVIHDREEINAMRSMYRCVILVCVTQYYDLNLIFLRTGLNNEFVSVGGWAAHCVDVAGDRLYRLVRVLIPFHCVTKIVRIAEFTLLHYVLHANVVTE